MTRKADAKTFLYKHNVALAILVAAIVIAASASQVALSIPSNPQVVYNQFSAVKPQSYLVFNDGQYTYAQSGVTGAIVSTSTDSDTVIQYALDHLTTGRTWKETVTLLGNFTVNSQINVPSYTKIDIDGKITQAPNVSYGAIFKNKNAGSAEDKFIEITGGLTDGNKGGNASSHVIWFDGVTNSTIHDIAAVNAGAPAGRNIYITTTNAARPSQNILLDNIFTAGATDSNIEFAGTNDGVFATSVHNLSATNIISVRGGERGIAFTNVQNSTMNTFVINGTVNNRGLDVGYGSLNNAISNGYIAYTKLSGLVDADSPTAPPADRNTYSNIIIYNATRFAVEASSNYLTFNNIHGEHSGQYGFQCSCNFTSITSSVMINNGKNAANTYDGFFIRNGRNNTLIGNVATDDQATKTQRYGITVASASGGTTLNNILANNVVSGNLQSKGINDSGTSTIIRNNVGFITENKGTATINSGSTSATVTHGLSYTPTAAECTVTWTENPTNDPGNWWLSGITSTQFTVNVRSDPGASNLDFGWACRRV